MKTKSATLGEAGGRWRPSSVWPPALPAQGATQKEAARLFNAGLDCYDRQDFYGAREKWEEALQTYRRLGLPKEEAGTLHNLGNVAAVLGDYGKAISYYEEALQIFRRLKLPKDEADALNNLGSVAAKLGDYSKARSYYEEALQIFRQQGLPRGEAVTLTGLGVVAWNLGDYGKAISYYEEALQTYRRLKLPKDEATTLNNLGVVAWNLGDYGKAISYYEEALKIRRRLGLPKDEADALNNLGNVAAKLGDYGKAISYYEEALQTYRRLKLPKEEADTLNNLGVVAWNLGDYGKAISYYEEALKIRRRLGLPREEADILTGLGDVAANLGDYGKARSYYEEALQTYRRLGLPVDEARTLNNLGDAYLAQGRFSEAREAFEKYPDPLRLGKYHLAAKECQKAKEYLTKALEGAKETRNAQPLVASLIALGLCAEGEGNWHEARDHFREAVKAVEEERESIPAGARGRFLGGKVFGFPRLEAYEGLVRVLHRLGQDEEAFRWSEHTKARELVEALAASSPKARAGLPQELRAKELELANKIAAKKKQVEEVFAKGNKELYARLEKELAALKEEQKELVARLYKDYPEYASLQYPRPLGARELALKEDEVLIAYEVTDPLTLVFLVRGGKVEKVFEVKLTRKELVEKVKAYREGFAAETLDDLRKLDLELGHRLYRELLEEPLRAAGGKKVLVVPDEILGLLPFEALVKTLPDRARWEFEGEKPYPAGVTFTGQERVFGYWHSGTSLTVTRRLGKKALGEGPLLAVADPVFSRQDRRVQSGEIKLAVRGGAEEIRLRREITAAVTGHLGYAGFDELASTADFVAALQKIWDRVKALTGLEASETNLKKENLENYAGVVLATHGIVDERVPYLRQPAIVLSSPDFTGEEDADGFLTASEVMDLKMRADVVAALACLTGVGGIVSGEGVMHLGRAFQYAGAKSALVSLWSVEDVSTNLFGEAFFAALKEGKDKDEALFLARRKLWEEGYRHPFYWSAFILFGEESRDAGGGAGFSSWWLVAGAAALLAVLFLVLRKRRALTKSG